MKNIAFFSSDFNMCVTLLMFLQNKYHITATSDIKILKNIIKSSEIDLIILDIEPSVKINDICAEIQKEFHIPIIITYVYKIQLKELDQTVRKHVNSVFYKPYDLNEVAVKVSTLVSAPLTTA